MVTQVTVPDSRYGQLDPDSEREHGTNLMVMHAFESRATHVLVIDPDLHELERTGHTLGAQGFKVTLSSTLLDFESLSYFAPRLLVLRPPAGQQGSWARYVGSLATDRRLRDLPVVWLTDDKQRVPRLAGQLAHVLEYPWRPFDFLSLVDTLLADLPTEEVVPRRFDPSTLPHASLFPSGAVGSD